MMHLQAILAFLLVVLASGLRAQTGPRVQIAVTNVSPAADATLARDEPFWVRVQFTTDEPIRIWARPYFEGRALKQVRTNASLEYSGSGYALGWFSLDDASEVDEIRILVGGGQPWQEWQAASHPVKLRGIGRASAPAAKALWVDELLEAGKMASRNAHEAAAREPASKTETALFSGFMLFIFAVVLGGIAAPAWAVWKWDGGWRIAAAIPAAAMTFVVGRIIIDTARDPTSHNLWPFEVLMCAVIGLGVIGLLRLARRFLHADE